MLETDDFPERKILGLAEEFIAPGFENSNAQAVIGSLWRRMSSTFFSLELDRDDFPVGIGAMWMSDSYQPGKMVYFAGYEIKSSPEDPGGLEELVLPGGKHAFYVHNGSLDTFGESNDRFYSTLFPNSGYERRPGFALEVYLESDSNGMPTKTLIALPIE